MLKRIIFHIDMNSYFASVEQQARPFLRGRPIGVCEHLGGIIIAPSVEAKRLGIKLGTTTWDARKIYPGIVLLPADPGRYRETTARFLKILRDYTDEVEQYSIDEAFLDASEICRNFEEALLLGLEIKQRLRQEVGEWLSCSIGIGPNKLTAKIAADLGEGDTDRIFVAKPADIASFYNRLKLTDVPGIGRRLERSLNKLGITSLKELAEYPLGNLLNQFGIEGYYLHRLSKFDDATGEKVGVSVRDDLPKSIGHIYTLPRPIRLEDRIKELMFKLAEKVGRRMRKNGARGMVIHYFHSSVRGKRRELDFSKQQKLKDFINDGREIYRAAWGIFHNAPLTPSLKRMGISVSGLDFNKPQPSLFAGQQKSLHLAAAMDRINDKYGEFTIRRGRLLYAEPEWARDTVGFGRMQNPLQKA